MPVPEPKRLILTDQTAGSVDDGEDEVCRQPEELQQGEPELGLPKGLDAEQLEAHEDGPEDEKVAPERDHGRPVGEDAADDVVLVGEDGGPDDEVVPAYGDREGLVYHSLGEGDEGASAGIQSCHLAEGLHDGECNDA